MEKLVMSQPKIGHGAKVQYSVDGTTFATLVGVTQGDFSGSKADTPETTSLDTPGVAKTFTSGLYDPGDYSAKLNEYPGDPTQSLVRSWFGDGIAHIFRTTDSSGIETGTFKGYVVSFDQSTNDDKIATRSLKLKVSGPITWGAASAPTDLSYTTPDTFVHGSAITPLDPTVDGIVDTYSVSPSLPAGLSINATTGVISGTPTAAVAATDYTVTATNDEGTDTFVVHITIT
jgi:hypothetical protein